MSVFLLVMWPTNRTPKHTTTNHTQQQQEHHQLQWHCIHKIFMVILRVTFFCLLSMMSYLSSSPHMESANKKPHDLNFAIILILSVFLIPVWVLTDSKSIYRIMGISILRPTGAIRLQHELEWNDKTNKKNKKKFGDNNTSFDSG